MEPLNTVDQENHSLRLMRAAGIVGAVVGLAVGEAVNFIPPVETNLVKRVLIDSVAMVVSGVGTMIVTAVRTTPSSN